MWVFDEIQRDRGKNLRIKENRILRGHTRMYNTASIQIQISNHVHTSQFILNGDDMKVACPYHLLSRIIVL
jgi:hypothetical protein